MFSTWWFKLYTKHTIIGLGKILIFSLILDQIVAHFISPLESLSTTLPLVAPFFYLMAKSSRSTLRKNIEFHKMNIPFPELKKALILDTVISIFTAFLFSGIFFSISLMIGGWSNPVFQEEFEMSVFVMLFYAISISLMFFYWMNITKDQKYLMLGPSKNFIKNFIVTFFLMLLPLSTFVPALLLGFSIEVFMFTSVASFFIGALFFHLKAIFHQTKPHGGFFTVVRYYFSGYVICSAIYMVLAFASKDEVFNKQLSAINRASVYEFSGMFKPNIDIETFKDIEKHVELNGGKEELYRKLDFDPNSLGLIYFLDKNDPYAVKLLNFLSSGKASAPFLISLYDHFEMHPEYWEQKKNYNRIRYVSFHEWPKNVKLPERFIVAKEESVQKRFENSNIPRKAESKIP